MKILILGGVLMKSGVLNFSNFIHFHQLGQQNTKF